VKGIVRPENRAKRMKIELVELQFDRPLG